MFTIVDYKPPCPLLKAIVEICDNLIISVKKCQEVINLFILLIYYLLFFRLVTVLRSPRFACLSGKRTVTYSEPPHCSFSKLERDATEYFNKFVYFC